MARNKLEDYTSAQLLEVIAEMKKKITRKNLDLTRARKRVSMSREKMQKMKATIAYQRTRILQLYRDVKTSNP
jgi:hypothetical protein